MDIRTEVGNDSHRAAALSFNNLYVAAGLNYYLKQSHIYKADNTETVTPSYALMNFSAGTDVQWKGKYQLV